MSASPQTIYIESSRAKLTLCRKSIEKFDEMHFLFSSPSDCSTCPRETERTQTDGPGLTRVESAGLRLAASLSYGEGEWARGASPRAPEVSMPTGQPAFRFDAAVSIDPSACCRMSGSARPGTANTKWQLADLPRKSGIRGNA